MPSENVQFRPRDELLTFEEITRVTRVAAKLGVQKLRLTGGEPLVRSELPALVGHLAAIPGIEDIALTTNGLLLADQAADLRAAGLRRLNVSLDALDDETFFRVSRRRGVDKILRGIDSAQKLGFDRIRLNSVIVPGLNDHQVVPLAKFARAHKFEIRFIEFMPLNAEGPWRMDQVITGEKLREIIRQELGAISPVSRLDPHQPARDYEYADGGGRVGFVDSVSQPFCQYCNRIRLMADGQLRNCLFSDAGWDAREILRDPSRTDDDLSGLIRDCVRSKWAGHGIQSTDFVKPRRAMYEIGG
jgi:cyclic pyranopterin phosphate synthase